MKTKQITLNTIQKKQRLHSHKQVHKMIKERLHKDRKQVHKIPYITRKKAQKNTEQRAVCMHAINLNNETTKKHHKTLTHTQTTKQHHANQAAKLTHTTTNNTTGSNFQSPPGCETETGYILIGPQVNIVS